MWWNGLTGIKTQGVFFVVFFPLIVGSDFSNSAWFWHDFVMAHIINVRNDEHACSCKVTLLKNSDASTKSRIFSPCLRSLRMLCSLISALHQNSFPKMVDFGLLTNKRSCYVLYNKEFCYWLLSQVFNKHHLREINTCKRSNCTFVLFIIGLVSLQLIFSAS